MTKDNFDSLKNQLMGDLSVLDPVDFNLIVKPYSKCFFGRYNPNTNKMYLYVYADEECTNMYSYETILDNFIHEYVHCYQYHQPGFVRNKGIMHNAAFHKLYNSFRNKVYEGRCA